MSSETRGQALATLPEAAFLENALKARGELKRQVEQWVQQRAASVRQKTALLKQRWGLVVQTSILALLASVVWGILSPPLPRIGIYIFAGDSLFFCTSYFVRLRVRDQLLVMNMDLEMDPMYRRAQLLLKVHTKLELYSLRYKLVHLRAMRPGAPKSLHDDCLVASAFLKRSHERYLEAVQQFLSLDEEMKLLQQAREAEKSLGLEPAAALGGESFPALAEDVWRLQEVLEPPTDLQPVLDGFTREQSLEELNRELS